MWYSMGATQLLPPVHFVVVTLTIVALTIGDVVRGSDTFCLTTAGVETCRASNDIKLARVQSKQNGEIQEVEVGGGRVLTLKTVSQKPLILEIPDFLSGEECDHFVRTAEIEGLKSSVTTDNKGKKADFTLVDKNRDRQLSIEEMRLTIEMGMDIYPDNEDILQMYRDMGLDKNGDELISKEELSGFSPEDLRLYLTAFLQRQPEKHSRFSKQVWLFPDNSTDTIFGQVQDRVSRVANLPIELIKLSDFQVVTYGVKGHYNAHYDSTDVNTDVPCCTRTRTRKCRICRYMTVLFYLSDVEEGGETAFPLADNSTIDLEKAQEERLVNLYRKCGQANLRVTPARGKAIVWYNHHINPDTGWLGAMDRYTFHGGCPVTKGTKWIANFWIKTTDNKLDDLHRMMTFSKRNLNSRVKDVKDEL